MQPSIIMVAHSKSMGTGIVNEKNIAFVDGRQLAVDGKFIVVLAKGTYDVIGVVAWTALFTEYRNMVIRAIHSRAHKICRTAQASTPIYSL